MSGSYDNAAAAAAAATDMHQVSTTSFGRKTVMRDAQRRFYLAGDVSGDILTFLASDKLLDEVHRHSLPSGPSLSVLWLAAAVAVEINNYGFKIQYTF